MATIQKGVDVPQPILDAASEKAHKPITKQLRSHGIGRDPITRDVLSLAIAWAEEIAKTLRELELTEAEKGFQRNRAFGKAAYRRLEQAAEGLAVSKADLLRAGLAMLAKKGMPPVAAEDLDELLEIPDEKKRLYIDDSGE